MKSECTGFFEECPGLLDLSSIVRLEGHFRGKKSLSEASRPGLNKNLVPRCPGPEVPTISGVCNLDRTSKIYLRLLARKQGTNLTLLAGAGSAAVFAWAFWWWRQRRGGLNCSLLLSFADGGRGMDDTVKQLLGLCFPCCFPRTSPPIFTALDAAVNQGSLDPVRAELASRPGCVNHPRREDGALPLHVAVRAA
jgi:hypothetical protein